MKKRWKIKALQVHNILLVPPICHAPVTPGEISPLWRAATFSSPAPAREPPLLCSFIGVCSVRASRSFTRQPVLLESEGERGGGMEEDLAASLLSLSRSASMETSGILGVCSLPHAGALPAKIAGSSNTPERTQSHKSICQGEGKMQHAAFEKEKRFGGAGKRRRKSQIS